MKNLKKVLALVIVFSMLLSVVAFASYPDVADDAYYASAVKVLSDIGIVKGDDEGNFNPDATITRAEVTAMVLRAMGREDAALASAGETDFDDVAADHWASGYINLASKAGIVVGNGDGTFGPDDSVTYAQAVKMVVCAVGHEYWAKKQGGWPTGYIVEAGNYKIDKNIPEISGNDDAPRAVVAMLISNGLEVYLGEEKDTMYGTTNVICNGKNDTEVKTLLETNLGISKIAGMVMTNNKTDIDGNTLTKEGVVRYYYTDVFKSTDEKLNDYVGSSSLYKRLTFNVGTTNAADTLGVNTIAYVKEVKTNEYDIVSILFDDAVTTKVVIDAADIDTGARTGDGKIAYFESESATKSTQLTLNATDLKVITNNETAKNVAPATFIAQYKALLDTAAVIEAVDNDGDEIFDTITVKKYIHRLVDKVDVARNNINFTSGSPSKLTVDPEDETKTITIKDQAGNILSLEDISADDVLAIVNNGTSLTNATVIDIVVLDPDTCVVEGKVNGRDPSTGKYSINGTDYALSAGFTSIKLGDEGTFYLDITGKIFAKVAKASKVDGNYGLIIQTSEYKGEFGAVTLLVEMLTSEGKVETFELADKVKTVDNVNYATGATAKNNVIAANVFNGTAWAGLGSGTMKWADVIKNAMFYEKTEVKDLAGQAARLVKYNTNADGEITALTPATKGQDSDVFNYNDTSVTKAYDSVDVRLGNNYLSESAVVFSIPTSGDLTDATAKSVNSLVDGNTYTYNLFDMNEDAYYGAVLVTGAADVFAEDAPIGIVTATGETYDEEDNTSLTTVSFVSENDSTVKTMVIDAEADVESTASTLEVGDVFVYNAGADDVITSYAIIAKLTKDAKGNTVFALDAKGSKVLGTDNEFLYGYVSTVKGSTLTLEGGNIGSDSVRITANTNQYVYDNYSRPSKASILAGEYEGPNFYSELYEDKDAGTAESTLVLVRTIDDIVVDVYTIASTYKVK